jgi:hypothetical protein
LRLGALAADDDCAYADALREPPSGDARFHWVFGGRMVVFMNEVDMQHVGSRREHWSK